MLKSNPFKFVVSLGLCFFVAFLGGMATAPAVSSWYQTINKPVWNPPSWIFGPVWTVLYLLMAISFFLIWKKGVTKKTKKPLTLFLVQLILNLIWSFIFFGIGNFWLAYAELIVLWVFILATIQSFWKISSTAGWLLIPYILWVSFAGVLNLTIALLN